VSTAAFRGGVAIARTVVRVVTLVSVAALRGVGGVARAVRGAPRLKCGEIRGKLGGVSLPAPRKSLGKAGT
jgi:hypothetical protein